MVRLNQIQVIGSHNSYHIAPEPAGPQADRDGPAGGGEGVLVYASAACRAVRQARHPPDRVDLFADPKGGLYANPRYAKLGKPADQVSNSTRTACSRSRV